MRRLRRRSAAVGASRSANVATVQMCGLPRRRACDRPSLLRLDRASAVVQEAAGRPSTGLDASSRSRWLEADPSARRRTRCTWPTGARHRRRATIARLESRRRRSSRCRRSPRRRARRAPTHRIDRAFIDVRCHCESGIRRPPERSCTRSRPSVARRGRHRATRSCVEDPRDGGVDLRSQHVGFVAELGELLVAAPRASRRSRSSSSSTAAVPV